MSSERPKPSPQRRRARAGMALAFAVAACGKAGDGDQGTPSAPDMGNAGSSGMEPSSGSEEMPATVLECTPGRLPRRAVWLSELQTAHAIEQLLGPAALDAEPDAAPEPLSQSGVVIDLTVLSKRVERAQRASASLEGRFTEVTGCAESDDACARAFIATLATKAFRRPVPGPELAELNGVYDVGRETDVETGVRLAVEAVIASASFNYRTELGTSAGRGAPVELTPHELASLLSFWLTDSPPDSSLADAAESGTLSDAAELARQVERLLATPEARDSVTHTLMSAWSVNDLFATSKDPALFPEYGPDLQSSMVEETRLFSSRALWSGGNLSEVLTSRTSFVNRALASLYGVPFSGGDPNEFVEVELPAGERAGLLTQPSLLSALAYADDTSVVARGLFVRASLLCLPRPPSKPESLLAQVPLIVEADLDERERTEYRAATSPCKNCHGMMDAFGLLFENYDAIGRYRRELDGAPIDSSANLDGVGFPGTFQGVLDFVDTAAESPDFSACVARQLAVYATGDEGLATTDCEFGALRELPPSATSLPQIIAGLASSALLTTRSGE